MVLINRAINEVTVKLVYYGPGLCGKTTNLEKIYGNPKLDNKGKMISMSTETDRTLFFDFMPMELGTIRGQKVRVQLYTVPGQVFYDATRKLVLRGADGVVFVADSQSTMRESNIDSLENLKTNLRLNRIDPQKVALVLQYNKRDLPNVDSVDNMNAYLNPDGATAVEASAITGTGVTATLRAAVSRILDNLKNNVDTTLHDEPELGAPDMTAKAGVTPTSAGTSKLSMKTTAAPPPEPPPPALPPFNAEETVIVSPFEVVPYEPESFADVGAVADEEDPFGAMAAVESGPDQAGDLFAASATATQSTGAERAELESLLASAREVVRALEGALERARTHESALRALLR